MRPPPFRDALAWLLQQATDLEWQTRHAAENTYCPDCARPEDAYTDQREHHPGCPYVRNMAVLREAFGIPAAGAATPMPAWVEYRKSWDAFCREGLNKPGVQVECGGVWFLLGDIDAGGGKACGDQGEGFSGRETVSRYRVLTATKGPGEDDGRCTVCGIALGGSSHSHCPHCLVDKDIGCSC
jgi:hypothetical protein